jgi:hypothetical protein
MKESSSCPLQRALFTFLIDNISMAEGVGFEAKAARFVFVRGRA